MKIRCLSPKHIINKYTKQLVIAPCGHCSACLQNKADAWVRRLQQESLSSRFTLFVTLTYNEKSVPYYTLDELGALVSESDMPRFLDSLNDESSKRYLSTFHNTILIPLVRDIQLFFKRLRKLVYADKHISEAQSYLRYFLVSEYGPTTFRPHYHMLLWCESEYFAIHASEFISKAWSTYNVTSKTHTSLGRIDCQHVRGDAAKYVATYLNCFSFIPSFLQIKPFRPFLLCSRRPPIGSNSFTCSQIREIVDRGIISTTIFSPSTNSHIDVPFSRSFENTIFPKCPRFAELSHRERISMYGLSSIYQSSKELLDSLWSKRQDSFSFSPLEALIAKCVRLSDYESFDSDVVPQTLSTSVTNAFRISCRVRHSRSRINMSLLEYTKAIENYYSRKDYSCLKQQLLFEENYSNLHNTDASLSYLIGLIDESLINNERKLPSSTYQSYMEQFHVTDFDSLNYRNSSFYLSQKQQFDEFIFKGKQNKLQNEYLESHPHLKQLHYNL